MQLYTVLLLAVGAQISVATTLPPKAVELFTPPTLTGEDGSSESGDSLAIEKRTDGTWQGWMGNGYTGKNQTFHMTPKTCITLNPTWNKKINSIKVNEGYSIKIYKVPDCADPIHYFGMDSISPQADLSTTNGIPIPQYWANNITSVHLDVAPRDESEVPTSTKKFEPKATS